MAAGREKDAKDIYDYYQSMYNDVDRIDLPAFNDMKFTSMQDFRTDQEYPAYVRNEMFLNRLYIDNTELFNRLMEEDKKKAQKTE